jgi:hypothetical protein
VGARGWGGNGIAFSPLMLQMHRFGGWRTIDGGIYRFQHSIHISGEIVVPEAQYPIPLSLKPAGASFISFMKIIASVL